MLEAITDFWKPMKKTSQEQLQPELLQVGSAIGFGFVPQAILSGRRLTVSAINTYQFGEEALTSFILTQEKDPGVSMIVAESEGEHYLAISRRIAAGDRMKLFTASDLDTVMNSAEPGKLACQDNVAEYKGWTVGSYKREINGLKGRIFKGDYRNAPLPDAGMAQAFEYTLLVSESNEQAIEIEKYGDGRIEVYATVYRRMSDVGEITHPVQEVVAKPEIKLVPAPEPVKPEPLPLQELTPPMPVPLREEPKPQAAMAGEAKAPAPTPITTTNPTPTNGVTQAMSTTMENAMKPKLYVQPTASDYSRPEVKAAANDAAAGFEAESFECPLAVANHLIGEAIRSERPLNDIVRRIIELPVANQESVQIPVTLSDEDYALLAIRYGITSSDRDSIKRRIMEDLNHFSGGKKVA